MNYPLVSVVVLNFNGKAHLKSCFESLKKQTYLNYECIMVDNSSVDGSVEYVQKNFSWVKVIQNKENLGYAEGNNIGVKHVKSDHVVILNNDIEADSHWLEELVKVVESNPLIGICGCKMMESNRKMFISSVGSSCDIYGFPYPIGAGEIDRNQYNLATEVFLIAGASFIIKSDLWGKIGGFDSKYFLFIEELDLCWRAHLVGYKVVVNPLAIVYHPAIGASTGKLTYAKKRYFMERNTQRTLIKNYSTLTLFNILPQYFALILGESFFFIFICRNFQSAFADFKNILWNIKNFKDTWHSHQIVQQLRIVDDKTIQSKMIHKSAKIRAGLEGFTGFGAISKRDKRDSPTINR